MRAEDGPRSVLAIAQRAVPCADCGYGRDAERRPWVPWIASPKISWMLCAV